MTEPKNSMSFPAAIQRVIDGGKITKLEWNDPSVYICLHMGWLKIKKKDGSMPQLVLSEADMTGNDWVSVVDA